MNLETFRHFSSIDEYVALGASFPNRNKYHSSGSYTWFGVADRQTAEAICKAGSWPAGMSRMERELAGFEAPAARSVKRRQVWADQGDSLDIHRVNSGQLDVAWQRTSRRSARSSRNIIICFPLMISSMHHADKLFWCGAAALKLTDLLTTAGYSVTLIGTHGTTNRGYTSHDSLIVKAAEAPLDIEALVVTVAFPGFVRTAGFRAIASNEFEVGAGLGQAIYDDYAPIKAMGLPQENILRGLFNQVSCRESARRWITDKLASLEQQQEAA